MKRKLLEGMTPDERETVRHFVRSAPLWTLLRFIIHTRRLDEKMFRCISWIDAPLTAVPRWYVEKPR